MSQVTELVKERVGGIVTRGMDRYGYFPVEEDRLKFFDIAVELLIAVTDRVETEEFVTITPLRGLLTETVFVVNFDRALASELLELVFDSVYGEIAGAGVIDPDTVRTYKRYETLLVESLSDLSLLLVPGLPEYLSNIPEYGVSELSVSLPATRSRLLAVNRKAGLGASVTRSRLPGRFSSLFQQNVISRADMVSAASPDINAITSDSKTGDGLPAVSDESLLTATFAGEGNKVYSDIKRLYSFAVEFGGYQGSITGAVEYQARYYEYLMAMSYGKRLPGGVVGGEFGKFDEMYGEKATDTRMPGLKFLNPLYTTRSGNQTVNGTTNPVSDKYRNGIVDRYVPPATSSSSRLDFVSLSLESVYVQCLRIGDTVGSLLNRPPDGIGNTSLHFQALAKVFPRSIDVRERAVGFTGAIGLLLSAHRSLYSLLGYEPDLHDINDRLAELSNLLSDLTDTVRNIGFKPDGYVPSLALTYYEPQRDKAEKRLLALGFDRVEVQEIMGITSMSELIDKFAPVTDSRDVISFFRAYDLTKLLYEFGGQEAVDRYTNYLYGVDPDKSLVRVLELLDRSRSLASKVTGSQYSRLIGYVVTLTYAVDPSQLIVFDSILKRNNLDLFESISRLLISGVPTILKRPEDVELLSGTVAQMVVADNTGYESQKPLWNDLIERSAGNIGKGVSGLYNRAEGITPTELHAALNSPSATSPLGKLLNGVRGGRMTSLLRYCNLFGLLYTLSPYRNSGQLVNEPADRYVTMLELLDTMETLTDRLKVSRLVLDNFAGGDNTSEVYSDPLIAAQNKEFSALIDTVKGDGGSGGNYRIVESPGIGNSRVPNGVRVTNSLTPEEAAVVSSSGTSLGVFTTQRINRVEEGSYVRVAVSNLLANGLGGTGRGGSGSVDGAESAGSAVLPVSDYTTTYESTVGGNTTSSPSSFNPVQSCRKFGGTGCDELGYDTTELCSVGYNKSLFPETGYGEDGIVPGVVSVDRPLGSGLDRTVTYTPVPPTHPQAVFTANGLSELSRSPVLKDTETGCASLRDPMLYGACMSLLKCKKFNPPYEGKYWFEFCPRTLQGGRLRR